MIKKNILVVNGSNYANAITDLGKMVFDENKFLNDPDSFKLVLFTGGEDISPELYGHRSPKHKCHNNLERDMQELAIFKMARAYGIKMTGICRGSQFLNVMNGGWIMHHINNHAGVDHNMTTAKGEVMLVTSTHHQMCVIGDKGFPLAWSTEKRSANYVGNMDLPCDYTGPEIEAFWYPAAGCAAVQYHPEYMSENSEGHIWYHSLVTDLLCLKAEEFTEKYVGNKAKSATR